ncbi:MAG: hypothetical protein RDU41_09940 [Clostridia bacterium]|nr:hypothetical protein [Clostridia bacterium]
MGQSITDFIVIAVVGPFCVIAMRGISKSFSNYMRYAVILLLFIYFFQVFGIILDWFSGVCYAVEDAYNGFMALLERVANFRII